MAAKSKKAKPSKTSTTAKKAPSSKKPDAKSSKVKQAAPAKKIPAKKAAAPAKATKPAAKVAAKPTAKIAAPAAKTKVTKSGLKQEVSLKAKTAKTKESDSRRTQANALIAAAMDDDDSDTDSDEDDEFDPEAFLAASGGKGLIRSHTMRKERVDLNLPVRYRLVKGPMVYNAILMNLSKTGLCLETKEKLKDKTVLRIEIPLPHTSELFAIQAEVIWSEKAPESGTGKNATFHLGMNFLVMSLAKKTVINNFIQQRRDEIVMAKIGLDRFSESVPVAGLD
jgi:hypothetical protein